MLGWVRLEEQADGTVAPVIDPAQIGAKLGGPAKAVRLKPVSATFLKNRSGRPIGVIAGKDGRALDVEETVTRIATELQGRAYGVPPAPGARGQHARRHRS